jgi:hypothetical protein
MQAAAFFVCGMIVGAAIYSGLASDQANRVIRENIELRKQMADYEENLSQLKKFRNKQTVIRSVTVYVEERKGQPPLDVVSEVELKDRLKRDLSVFVGRSIYDIGIEAQIARGILNGKIYSDIGQKDYKASIRTMLVVDGTLSVWAEVSKYVGP